MNNLQDPKLNEGDIIDNDVCVTIGRSFIPNNITFRNNGYVNMYFLIKLPNNIIFDNTEEILLPINVDLSDLSYAQLLKIYNKIGKGDRNYQVNGIHYKYLSKKDLLPLFREKKLEIILNK